MSTTPSGIVPRWEWRTFGEHFGNANARLAALDASDVRDSDEVYFLSRHSDASVKLRDGVMDVKQLQEVDAERLELWLPVMKAAFPLSSDDVASVLSKLGVTVAPLGRDHYTLDEFESELVRPSEDLQVVHVHKRRAHYLVDECMVELTDIWVDDVASHTLALESPDPEVVTATVRAFGLGERRNVSMARGIKALVGFDAKRYAVIDVGTNSVKFHVAERRADGELRTIVDRADITRLGEGLDESGRLAAEPIRRTVAAIDAMVEEAHRDGAVAVAAVGTAGLRVAPNSADLVDAVRSETGVRIEVISGEEEGQLAYRAATTSLPVARGSLVVFDSGGGSTQFSFGHGSQVEERFSLDVGAVRIAERYRLAGAVSEDELKAALAGVAAELGRLDARPVPDAVVGMGGTVTNLAAVKHGLERYDPDVVQGTVLDLAEIDRQIELYRGRSSEQRGEIAGLQPARAEVILAGACIVRTVLTTLRQETVTVSDRGLRHGVVVERFGQ
jgi:exopolyphosphatase / guanosine-5'-triphosphate,3'-diphosphate pyrophosphatase